MILILLIGLIIFSNSCTTVKPEIEADEVLLSLPTDPFLKPVKFIDMDTGMFLTFKDYRNLENNILEYRSYIDQLKKQVYYYREDNPNE